MDQSNRSGGTFFDQTKTLLEPRTVTGEIAGAAWKIPSVKADSSNFLHDDLLISGTWHVLREMTVFASDDVVFAWAIGKALLIVIVSFGILVYAAWAVTWPRKNAAHGGIPKDSVEGARRILPRTSAEAASEHQADEPTVAA